MPNLLYTVDNLVDEVRSLIDEQNVDSVDTDRDILPSLNRAQDFAFDIYARRYPEPILKPAALAMVGDQADYPIPDEVFEDRILKVEFGIPSSAANPHVTYRECMRVSYRDITNYESASKTNIPYYYCIFGRTIRFVPTPTGTYDARIWYLRNPEKLVPPQGRVTRINTTSNYCIVDTAGSSLTTESDQLGSYVNWVDGQTGEIKATLQIAILNENKVTFRSSPLRATVLNRTVASAIPDDAELDDYLSPVDGICVPYYGRPTCNFLIQYTAAEITRKLGGEAVVEEVLKKFEEQVEKTWIGRERQMRVQKRSQNWGVPTRRWFYE